MAGSTRREFLRNGWRVGGAMLAVAGGWTLWESLRPLAGNGIGGKLKLSQPSAYQAETATYVPEGRLFIANTGTTLLAVSQKCPHLGCQVPFCESSGRFECPCHGSVFDIGGEWIEGPAPTGMTQYPVALQDGVVVVDTSTTITGAPRGSHRYLSPPKGPRCKAR
jgi:nitrite reductase/ring-hydroxylating ferredoxin subunit